MPPLKKAQATLHVDTAGPQQQQQHLAACCSPTAHRQRRLETSSLSGKVINSTLQATTATGQWMRQMRQSSRATSVPRQGATSRWRAYSCTAREKHAPAIVKVRRQLAVIGVLLLVRPPGSRECDGQLRTGESAGPAFRPRACDARQVMRGVLN